MTLFPLDGGSEGSGPSALSSLAAVIVATRARVLTMSSAELERDNDGDGVAIPFWGGDSFHFLLRPSCEYQFL